MMVERDAVVDGPQVRQLELRWDTLAAHELPAHPTLLRQLLDGEIDGITVTGVFSAEEAADAVARLDALREREAMPHAFGSLLGMALGMVTREDGDRSRHIADAARCKPLYREAFGVDPFQRLAEVLAPIAEGLPLVPASEDGQDYNPGQVRWWDPGKGGLTAHVGNEFRRHLEDGAMKHLVTTTDITDHLSYFVVLQRCTEGGALSVYDLLFEDNRGRDGWDSAMPDDSWIEDRPCVRFDPEPGSLILFGGGWRWHRVDPPGGETPRITWGGFAARSLDGREVHFWS
jgi:hypothetical protein